MAEYNNGKIPQWQSNRLKELGSLLKIYHQTTIWKRKKTPAKQQTQSCLT